MKEYHILNGDALLHQLEDLEGTKIVLRECLIEGSTTGNSLEEVLRNRIPFFEEDYFQDIDLDGDDLVGVDCAGVDGSVSVVSY